MPFRPYFVQASANKKETQKLSPLCFFFVSILFQSTERTRLQPEYNGFLVYRKPLPPHNKGFRSQTDIVFYSVKQCCRFTQVPLFSVIRRMRL